MNTGAVYEDLTIEEYDQRITDLLALDDLKERHKGVVKLHSLLIHDNDIGKYTKDEVRPIIDRLLSEVFGLNKRGRPSKRPQGKRK